MSMGAIALPRTRWPKPRIFKLGFFVGRGLKVGEIAELLDSTVHTVRTMTNNMGGAFSDVPGGNLMIDVSRPRTVVLDGEARRRQQTTEALISMVVGILADDPTLLANVLDD